MVEKTDTPPAEKLIEKFSHDSRILIESLSTILLDLEKVIGAEGKAIEEFEEKVNQAFREIHSLKSESSYLGYEDVTDIANDIETILEELRRGDRELTRHIIDTLLSLLDSLESSVHERKKESSPVERFRSDGVELQPESEEPQRGVQFDEFEKNLILEARERGEKVYRMVCEIDDSESMKYPRIYLIINNLEILVNVIKVIPDIEEIEKKDISEVVLYFSSSVEEKDIYSAVNIDQIKRIQIISVDYPSLPGGWEQGSSPSVSPGSRIRQKYTRIEAERLDDLLGYVDEMHFNLHRMDKTFDQFMKMNTRKEFDGLSALISAMEAELKLMRMEPFSREFNRLPRLVRDASGKLGKKVEIEVQGGDITIDRRLLDILSDPIFHLVRNAVDHGIEKPEERTAAGKAETGTILVSAVVVEEQVIIQVADDGRVIDKNTVSAKAHELGIPVTAVDSMENLFALVSHPGFSTASDVSDYSGRGVGLDLVAQKIKQIECASIRMVTRPGEGTIFTITIPKGFSLLPLVLAKSKEMTLAVPKRSIEETVAIASGNFTRNEEGALLYGGIPVFTVNGRVLMKDKTPEEQFGIIISHLGEKGCLLVDELLFEKEVPEDTMFLGKETIPHIYPVTLNKRKTDFFYLNPSLIV